MGKRFTATEKWSKAWFRKLSPKHKLIWFYLVDNCDNAGIWEIDYEMMSFQIGEEILKTDLDLFGSKLNFFKSDKLLITDFIEFQYGVLSPNSNFHKPIIAILKKNNLKYLTPNEPLMNPSLRVMDKDIYKDKDKDKDYTEIKKFISEFNSIRGTKIRSHSPFEDNYFHWRKDYEYAEIIEAVKKAKGTWFDDKLTPVMLFRIKNSNHEKVNYIENLLERTEKKADPNGLPECLQGLASDHPDMINWNIFKKLPKGIEL